MPRSIIIAGLCLCLLAPMSAHAMVISISDTEFQNSDWSITELTDTTPNNSAAFTGTQVSSGGNPGNYRRLTNEMNTPTASSIAAGHLYLGLGFDPGEDGHFASLSFSFDGISDPASPSGAVAYQLLAEQNGNFFRAPASFIAVISGTGWQNNALSGVTASDFVLHSGTGSLDLTDSGSLVRFGIFTSNGSAGEPSINIGGFDNFNVSVAVSSPGSAAILIPALVAVAGFRRVRRRR